MEKCAIVKPQLNSSAIHKRPLSTLFKREAPRGDGQPPPYSAIGDSKRGWDAG